VTRLQAELARLTRAAGQPAPPTTAVASAAAVWAPGAESPAPDFDALMVEANRLLRLGDSAAAVERFEQALALRPGEARARLGLAAGRYAQGRTAEALVHVEDLLNENGDNAEALGMKSLLVWREGDLRQAARLLDRALRLAPEDVRLRNYRGIIAFERHEYEDALDDLEMAVELDPEDPESRFNLAVLLARRPEPHLDAAREHYAAALAFGGNRDEELEKVLAR
jgi:Flp pilus assembly protein TadD